MRTSGIRAFPEGDASGGEKYRFLGRQTASTWALLLKIAFVPVYSHAPPLTAPVSAFLPGLTLPCVILFLLPWEGSSMVRMQLSVSSTSAFQPKHSPRGRGGRGW